MLNENPVIEALAIRQLAKQIAIGRSKESLLSEFPAMSEELFDASTVFARDNLIDGIRTDRTTMTAQDNSVQYWRSKPVEERIDAMQRLRVVFYGDAASGPMDRFFEIGERE